MSYTNLLYHIVFRTMGSVLAITEEHETELYRYIWSFAQYKRCVLKTKISAYIANQKIHHQYQ
ncbi:hypothetical protein BMT54_09830 [Pasteurellaceae bacterium 15-036681]|nr:hypothetical protein BMT54_09830 [Pasteurellaceae bacterium 15-036681]